MNTSCSRNRYTRCLTASTNQNSSRSTIEVSHVNLVLLPLWACVSPSCLSSPFFEALTNVLYLASPFKFPLLYLGEWLLSPTSAVGPQDADPLASQVDVTCLVGRHVRVGWWGKEPLQGFLPRLRVFFRNGMCSVASFLVADFVAPTLHCEQHTGLPFHAEARRSLTLILASRIAEVPRLGTQQIPV
ncbi:hypothetical protein BC629DRAFT_253933 [Irpex lacteus]|nr:hypothetical protein BC629DRAFT_253933 [Irpex lacteus]